MLAEQREGGRRGERGVLQGRIPQRPGETGVLIGFGGRSLVTFPKHLCVLVGEETGFGSVEKGIEEEEFKSIVSFCKKLSSGKESVAGKSRSFEAESFRRNVKTDTSVWATGDSAGGDTGDSLFCGL